MTKVTTSWEKVNIELCITCIAWSSTVCKTFLSMISKVGFWVGPGAG